MTNPSKNTKAQSEMEPSGNWIDAHCHLPLEEDVDASISRSSENHVTGFVMGGIDESDWKKQIEIQAKYPDQVFPVFGVHPWVVIEKSRESWQAEVSVLVKERYLRRGFGLGEIGLDFFKDPDRKKQFEQIEAFEQQLELNRPYERPLVLHIVKGHMEAKQVLNSSFLPKNRGIIHSFSAGPLEAKMYLDLGFVISVGPAVVKKGYKGLKEALKIIPLENLVLETDSPAQLPGSAWINDVAQVVSLMKGVSISEIYEHHSANIERIFGVRAKVGPKINS